MKKLPLLIKTIICLFLFNGCHEPKSQNCCEGYTGPITNHWADSLTHKDNFIPKDSIIAWTTRFQNNLKFVVGNALPGTPKVLGDSSSFNRCIIKSIICNDSCIGLRVIYGMSPNMTIHVILVGIKPDYSTLYINKSEVCNSRKTVTQKINLNQSVSMAFGNPSGSGMDTGGAEYGMEP